MSQTVGIYEKAIESGLEGAAEHIRCSHLETAFRLTQGYFYANLGLLEQLLSLVIFLFIRFDLRPQRALLRQVDKKYFLQSNS